MSKQSMDPDVQQQYDVTVIGGGIHGAGVAQAAAAAGYSVLLLEKNAWAAGTSSKSSKLIHGGLRYLQSGQFSLVKESIKERETLLKIAPSLVRRNNFYIPIYNHSHYKSWQLHIGLTLYALFGLFRKECRYKMLPLQEANRFNGLKTKGLKQLFCYPDAQTDDQLLTQAVINSARSLGAHTLKSAPFLSAKHVGGGYSLNFEWAGSEREVFSQIVINAGGPWANYVNDRVSPTPPGASIDLVQGTHLILSGQISDECFYLEAPQDQRAVFVLPWYGNTLLGTTETIFVGHPDQVSPQTDETEYLLTVLKHYFPDFDAKVIDSFAGLRVLPRDESKHAFHRPRETQLICDSDKAPQWVSVYGGKLTGYRSTAEKVVKLIRQSIGNRKEKADTSCLPLEVPTCEPEAPHAIDQNAG